MVILSSNKATALSSKCSFKAILSQNPAKSSTVPCIQPSGGNRTGSASPLALMSRYPNSALAISSGRSAGLTSASLMGIRKAKTCSTT